MFRTRRVFEHQRLYVGSDGIRADELDAIARFNDRHGGQYFGALGWLDLVATTVRPKEKNQTDRHQSHKSQNQDFARAFKAA